MVDLIEDIGKASQEGAKLFPIAGTILGGAVVIRAVRMIPKNRSEAKKLLNGGRTLWRL